MDGLDDTDGTFFCFHRRRTVSYDSVGDYCTASASRRAFKNRNNPRRPAFYQPVRVSLYLPILAGVVWSSALGGISMLSGVRCLRVSLGLKKVLEINQ